MAHWLIALSGFAAGVIATIAMLCLMVLLAGRPDFTVDGYRRGDLL